MGDAGRGVYTCKAQGQATLCAHTARLAPPPFVVRATERRSRHIECEKLEGWRVLQTPKDKAAAWEGRRPHARTRGCPQNLVRCNGDSEDQDAPAQNGQRRTELRLGAALRPCTAPTDRPA